MKKILPGLHVFTGLLMGRVYLIEDPDGLTMIDTGLSLAADRIIRQLQDIGRQAGEVRRILITHAHPDHVGGLPRLKALTGAEVIASELERPVIEGKIPISRRPADQLSGLARLMAPANKTFRPTPVDRVVGDGDVLSEAMGGLHVVFTPGHAPGHLAFWQPEQRVLFCGDTIFHIGSMRLPFAVLTVDMEENKRSIRRLVALNPGTICFGHGAPWTRDTAQELRSFAHRVGAA